MAAGWGKVFAGGLAEELARDIFREGVTENHFALAGEAAAKVPLSVPRYAINQNYMRGLPEPLADRVSFVVNEMKQAEGKVDALSGVQRADYISQKRSYLQPFLTEVHMKKIKDEVVPPVAEFVKYMEDHQMSLMARSSIASSIDMPDNIKSLIDEVKTISKARYEQERAQGFARLEQQLSVPSAPPPSPAILPIRQASPPPVMPEIKAKPASPPLEVSKQPASSPPVSDGEDEWVKINWPK